MAVDRSGVIALRLKAGGHDPIVREAINVLSDAEFLALVHAVLVEERHDEALREAQS